MQETSRTGLRRLKALHLPSADLTYTAIDAISLYLCCDDVALRQLSLSQNAIPCQPLHCEIKSCFLLAANHNQSLTSLLTRQCGLTCSELDLLNTSMRRNLHRINAVKGTHPPVFITSKPALQWSDQLRLAMRASLSANSCETAFYEVLVSESNQWNLKKPPVIKLVQRVPIHHWLTDILRPTTTTLSTATKENDNHRLLSGYLLRVFGRVLDNLASLQQLHEAHSLLRFKEDVPLQSSHVLINSFREDGERNHHNSHGHTKQAKHHHHKKNEEVSEDLRPLQKSVIEALQTINKIFILSEARLTKESERIHRVDGNLRQAWNDYHEGSQEVDRMQKRLGELQHAVRRQQRSRDKLRHHHHYHEDQVHDSRVVANMNA